jgi:hypothetical protein
MAGSAGIRCGKRFDRRYQIWVLDDADRTAGAKEGSKGFGTDLNLMLGVNGSLLAPNIGLEAIRGLHDSGMSKTHTR